MSKAVFSVGGIIGCWRFKKIADCASMRSWQVNHWPNAAPPPGSIARCGKAKIRPITHRSGRNFLLRHPEQSAAKACPERSRTGRRISKYLPKSCQDTQEVNKA